MFYHFIAKYTEFFVEKKREAFAVRLTFFQQKILAELRY